MIEGCLLNSINKITKLWRRRKTLNIFYFKEVAHQPKITAVLLSDCFPAVTVMNYWQRVLLQNSSTMDRTMQQDWSQQITNWKPWGVGEIGIFWQSVCWISLESILNEYWIIKSHIMLDFACRFPEHVNVVDNWWTGSNKIKLEFQYLSFVVYLTDFFCFGVYMFEMKEIYQSIPCNSYQLSTRFLLERIPVAHWLFISHTKHVLITYFA